MTGNCTTRMTMLKICRCCVVIARTLNRAHVAHAITGGVLNLANTSKVPNLIRAIFTMERLETEMNKIEQFIEDMEIHGFIIARYNLTDNANATYEDAANALKTELERCYIELPKTADGEYIHVGDTVYYIHQNNKVYDFTVEGFHFLQGKHAIYPSKLAHALWYREDDVYKNKPELDEPEVLDADGVPIKVGDVVFWEEPCCDYSAMTVKGFNDRGEVLMHYHNEHSLGYKASLLTHKEPDTQEKIDADVEECEYESIRDRIFSLLERQRELDKRKYGNGGE